MGEQTDFDSFYDQHIQPSLAELKAGSKLLRIWGVIVAVLIIAGIASFIGIQADAVPVALGWICFVGIIISIAYYRVYTRRHYHVFKENVIQKIIAFLHPGLAYHPGKYISTKLYRASGLYRRRYKMADGSDLIKGTYKNIAFQCSELEVGRRQHADEYGGRVLFKGLFFSAQLNVSFYGGTYIWIKGNEQLPVSIADDYYALFPLPKVYQLKTGHPAFNKIYSVYSTDISEGHAWIDNGFMDLLLNFRQQIGRDITCSFVAGRCYVAIPINEDLLEPAGGDVDKETVKEHFFAVLLVLSIINQLQLNKWA